MSRELRPGWQALGPHESERRVCGPGRLILAVECMPEGWFGVVHGFGRRGGPWDDERSAERGCERLAVELCREAILILEGPEVG